jgi:hypothetical protein
MSCPEAQNANILCHISRMGLYPIERNPFHRRHSPKHLPQEDINIMRTKARFGFLAGIFLFVLVAHGAKDHPWQTGKVLDAEQGQYFKGTMHNGQQNGTVTDYGNTAQYHGSSSGSNIAVYRKEGTYEIDSPTMVYLLDERTNTAWSHTAHLTVNGTVRFYVDGHKMHILDDDGKEKLVEIVKQTLKQ